MDEHEDEWDDFAPAPAAASRDDDPEDPLCGRSASREAASRARSAEILSRTPTPEEIAEHEERARANKIAAIMARPEPTLVEQIPQVFEPKTRDVRAKAAVITKIRPDALLEGGQAGPIGPDAARAVPGLARRGTAQSAKEEKRVQWWAERLADIYERMQTLGMPELAKEFLREIAAVDVAWHRKQGASDVAAKKRIRKLKARVKALEEQAAVAFAPEAKPRVRVKAGRLPQLTSTPKDAHARPTASARGMAGEW